MFPATPDKGPRQAQHRAFSTAAPALVTSSPLSPTTLTMNANAPWGWGRGRGEAHPLTVTTVVDGAQAESAGVRVGWTINGINGVPVNSEAEFKALIAGVKRHVPYSMPAWVNVTFDTAQRPTTTQPAPTTTTRHSTVGARRLSGDLLSKFAFHRHGAEAPVASKGALPATSSLGSDHGGGQGTGQGSGQGSGQGTTVGGALAPGHSRVSSFHGDDATAAMLSAAAHAEHLSRQPSGPLEPLEPLEPLGPLEPLEPLMPTRTQHRDGQVDIETQSGHFYVDE